MPCGIAWQAHQADGSSPAPADSIPAYLSPPAARLLVGVSVYREPVGRNAVLFQIGETSLDESGLRSAPAPARAGETASTPRAPYEPPPNLTELVTECEASGLLTVSRMPRGQSRAAGDIPPLFVEPRTAAALHREMLATGRGDEITRAHQRAAEYWHWRATAWPQDQDADVHDLLEARYHQHQAGGSRRAIALTEMICAQLHDWGQLDREAALIRETLTWLPPRSLQRASWIQELGKIAQVRGDYTEARRRYQQSLDICTRAGDGSGVSRSHHMLGVLAQAQGDYAEAERRYQQSTGPAPLPSPGRKPGLGKRGSASGGGRPAKRTARGSPPAAGQRARGPGAPASPGPGLSRSGLSGRGLTGPGQGRPGSAGPAAGPPGPDQASLVPAGAGSAGTRLPTGSPPSDPTAPPRTGRPDLSHAGQDRPDAGHPGGYTGSDLSGGPLGTRRAGEGSTNTGSDFGSGRGGARTGTSADSGPAGTSQAGPGHSGTGFAGDGNLGSDPASAGQADARKGAARKSRAGKAGTNQADANQAGAGQNRAGQLGAGTPPIARSFAGASHAGQPGTDEGYAAPSFGDASQSGPSQALPPARPAKAGQPSGSPSLIGQGSPGSSSSPAPPSLTGQFLAAPSLAEAAPPPLAAAAAAAATAPSPHGKFRPGKGRAAQQSAGQARAGRPHAGKIRARKLRSGRQEPGQDQPGRARTRYTGGDPESPDSSAAASDVTTRRGGEHAAASSPGRGRLVLAGGATVAAAAALVVGIITGALPGPQGARHHNAAGTPSRPANGGGTSPGPQSLAGRNPAAQVRAQTAAWAVRHLSRGDVVSCDPAMCAALTADGFPTANLITLNPQSNLNAGDVVIATEAVRSMFGSRLTNVFAPDAETSIGSGSLAIQVRVIAPYGAPAYRTALRQDLAERRAAGLALSGNSNITATPAALRDLTTGMVDSRLLSILVPLASTEHVHIAGFVSSAGASPGMPVSTMDITLPAGPQSHGPSGSRQLHSALVYLAQQQPPFRLMSHRVIRRPGQQPLLQIQFGGPCPLGILGGGSLDSVP